MASRPSLTLAPRPRHPGNLLSPRISLCTAAFRATVQAAANNDDEFQTAPRYRVRRRGAILELLPTRPVHRLEMLL
jgi:hypothetical protein